jgi:hypothetical protein|tara:strand:+ start:2053 stop:2229 length:177 start_codon:yes stop_codon:yes gene_type:complete
MQGGLDVSINTCMQDKKAAKKLIKRAKKNPSLYSTMEVMYARMIRKSIKKDETKTEKK